MPSRTSRGWVWMVMMIVSLGISNPSSVVADSPDPLPSSRFASQLGSTSDEQVFERLPRAMHTVLFETWRGGNADANLPPEALRMLVPEYGGDMAQASPPDSETFDDEFITEYDPWEGFNRAVFGFNRQVDRYVLKPVAKVWNAIVPELAQESLANAFDNIAMPRRFINNVFQLKFERAGREIGRFLINTSMGVLGFFDAAADVGLPKLTDEDTGQTLGHYGVRPGPYLVLPFLPPLTVRDAFGFGADAAMAPLSYVLPFEANTGMRGGQVVNERSLNLEFFDQLERETFDLYTAVRNAYLQRRQRAVEE